jgi:uncharacterized membrane protein YhaH (DUF805 family)
MNCQTAISVCLSKYATFGGRATRSEYWWFYLFTVLLNWVVGIVGDASGQGLGTFLSLVISTGLFIPTLAAGSRRLHDTGRSGWWQLLVLTVIGMIWLIVWWATSSQPGSNAYGEEPGMTAEPVRAHHRS